METSFTGRLTSSPFECAVVEPEATSSTCTANKLRGKRSVCRNYHGVKLLDFQDIRKSAGSSPVWDKWLYRIVDNYHGDLAGEEVDRFMLDLDRQQAIMGAAGLGTISSEVLRRMSELVQWVTIFDRRDRGHGWVYGTYPYIYTSSTEPRAYSDGQAAIRRALLIEDWGDLPLDENLQAYAEYIMAAKNLEADYRFEEAFLHVVFGLDLLLGGKSEEPLTAVLAERVGLLSHGARHANGRCSLVRKGLLRQSKRLCSSR